jgi:hypothetical protein
MHWHSDIKTYILVALCLFVFGLVLGFAYWWATYDNTEAGQSSGLITPKDCELRNGQVFGGFCYTLNSTESEDNQVSWFKAEETCRNGAGNLASILTEEENQLVGDLAGGQEVREVWIGISKNNGIRESFWVFEWSDGSTKLTGANYDQPWAAWAEGEPEGTPGFQDCGYLRTGSAAAPEWYLVGGADTQNACYNPRDFVCKFPLASGPGRPTNVTATSAPGGITLEWSYPVSDGGRPVTKYMIKAMPNTTLFPLLEEVMVDFTLTADNNCTDCQYTINDLQPTAYYAVSISAVNEVDMSAYEDADPMSVRVGERAPDAPNPIGATAGNTECTVKFDKYPPGYDGGKPVTAFDITATAGSSVVTVPPQTGQDLLKEFYLIQGLSNDETYTIEITATNEIGTSAAGTLSCTPSGIHPTTPSLDTIVLGFREVNVTYTQPNTDNNTYEVVAYADPICEYFDGSNEEDNDCPQPAMSGSSTDASGTLTIMGLTTLQPYLIYIQSSNTLNDGEVLLSSPAYRSGSQFLSVEQTLPTNPGPVENVRLAGNQTNGLDFTVLFDYPAEDGDAPLSMIYMDLYGPPDNTTNGTWGDLIASLNQTAVPDGSFGAITVDGQQLGLVQNTNYTVSLVIENEYNLTSPAVEFGPITTGNSAPSPPTDVSAVAGARSAVVSWKAPSNYGAGETSTDVSIVEYTIASNPGPADPSILAPRMVTPAEAGCDCAGLSPQACRSQQTCSLTIQLGVGSEDQLYEFFVQARSDSTSTNSTVSASSEPSNIVTILATTASAPQNVAVVPFAKGLTVTYEKPADNGGRSVQHYEVKLDGIETPYLSVVNRLEVVIPDLDPRSSYSGTIKAITEIGEGAEAAVPASSPSADNPSKPLDVRSKPDDEQVTVTWAAPLDDGGADITSYRIFNSGGSPTDTLEGVTDETKLTKTFKGLKNGQEYNFRVVAINADGLESEESAASAAVKPGVTYTTLEWVGGVSAAVIVLAILGLITYTIWWAWVEKELCWDDGDPNTRANARKRKEQEMAAKKAEEEGGDGTDLEAGEITTEEAKDTTEEAKDTGSGGDSSEPAASTEEAAATSAEGTGSDETPEAGAEEPVAS